MTNRRTIIRKMIIPSGVTVTYENRMFIAVGPKGEVKKTIFFPSVQITIDTPNNEVIATSENAGKKEKMLIGTAVAHMNNVIKGASESFVYKLKVCSGHFPMTASISGNKLSVKNYLGEKVPRVLTVKEGASVKVDGELITVESTNKEIAGQVAADIELLMRITNRDRRIFQDGIFITEKNGKAI